MFKRISSWILVLVPLALIGFGALNINAIEDWFKLRGYNPPASIVSLADQDTMTAYTRRLFYINHPLLVNGVENFRSDCPENQSTIVLGCYHPGLNGIYIYNVTTPELAGVTQVTAAHEVLHAVYARLSSAERSRLNQMLESYFQNGLSDSRVKAEVKIYQQTEPNDVYDEMSCTFGTEIADLPSGLDDYYKKYFSDRSKITAYEAAYEDAFTSRQNQISADDSRLASMKNQIDSLESSLSSQLAQINSDKARLDSERNSGDYVTYNSNVATYNTEVDAYNRTVDDLRNLISSYNYLVSQRNSLASQVASLQKSLDTRTLPSSVGQ